MVRLGGAAVVRHPTARVMKDAAALALQDGFAILERPIAERAETL